MGDALDTTLNNASTKASDVVTSYAGDYGTQIADQYGLGDVTGLLGGDGVSGGIGLSAGGDISASGGDSGAATGGESGTGGQSFGDVINRVTTAGHVNFGSKNAPTSTTWMIAGGMVGVSFLLKKIMRSV